MAEGQATVRAMRLLAIAGYLARRDRLTSAEQIAETFEVSTRTIYRDIQDLRSLGLDVEGEAGVGYIARRLIARRWLDELVYRNPLAAKCGHHGHNSLENSAGIRGVTS